MKNLKFNLFVLICLSAFISFAQVSSLDDLTDATKTGYSLYLGNPPGSVTGDHNTSFGVYALDAITSGQQSSAFGSQALSGVTTGRENTGLGYFALRQVQTGSYNVAVGSYAQWYSGSTISNNTSVGHGTLNTVDGHSNTALGSRTLGSLTTASYNTAVGAESGRDITTGTNNTLLGYDSDVSSATAINQTAIGYTATGQADNSVVLGNADVTAIYMAQDSGATVYAGGLNIGGVYSLPTSDGTDGQVLSTDGSGALSWTDSSGSSLTDLNVTSTAAELNILDGVTSTATELNILDGVTANATELNLLDGVTSLMTSSGNETVPILSETSINAWGSSLNSLYIGNAPSTTTDDATQNIAIGKTALKSITSGYQNTVVGWESGKLITTGIRNTVFGTRALENETGGSNNTAVGQHALFAQNGANYNTAVGVSAMQSNSSGNKNTAVGVVALSAMSSGSNNTALGYYAGYALGTGSNNVIIGHETDPSAADASNQIVIGANATGQGNNSVTLGDSNVTAVYMAEDSGAHLYAGDATFGGDVTISSDSRLKSNIVSLGATLSKLLLIDGKSYIMNNSGKEKIGILAQDVQKVFPELVSEDANEMLSVNYQGLVPVLINAIKEQEDKISRLESLVEKLISEK